MCYSLRTKTGVIVSIIVLLLMLIPGVAVGDGVAPATNLVAYDPDDSFPGVDGRDFHITWTPSVTQDVYYQAIYILPDGEPLNSLEHEAIAVFNNNTTNQWTGTEEVTEDSAGGLVGAGNYRIYVFSKNYDQIIQANTSMTAVAEEADTTPPEFAADSPQKHENDHHPGSRYVSFTVKPKDETVKAYYIVVNHDPDLEPDKDDVIAGKDGTGGEPLKKGNYNEVRPNGYLFHVGQLPADDTLYDIYVVIQDSAGNASEPAKLELRTPVKLLTDGYPIPGTDQAAGSKKVQILNKANGDCTAYVLAVPDDGTPPSPGQIMQGMEGTYESPMAAGSVELEADTETPMILTLPADATNYDVHVMLYKNYHGGGFIVGIYSEIVKLDVTSPPRVTVCEIVETGVKYYSLSDALDVVADGQTIKLLQDIDHSEAIEISGKSITFDLNGYTLDVVVTGDGDAGLWVMNGAVYCTDTSASKNGEFNVTGDDAGVQAMAGGEAHVTNATATGENRYGAWANGDGAKAVVHGDATGTAFGADAANGGKIEVFGNAEGGGIGARAYGISSKVTVHGLVSGGTKGALAEDGSTIELLGGSTGGDIGVDATGTGSIVNVAGNVSATNDGAIGVRARGTDSEIYVTGNVTATATGAWAEQGTQITIDGTITANTYIKVGNDSKTIDQYEGTTTKAGYRTYTDGINTVWVKIPPTPGPGSPSGGSSSGGGGSKKKEEVVVVEEPEVPQAPSKVIVLTPGSGTALVNGQETVLDAAPFINPETARAMVPIRFVSEQLGAYVEWLPDTRQVTITLGDMTIILTIGSNQVLVNGVPVEIDAPAEIINGRTYVPLRFVSETLGATALWDEVTKTITITK